jgi:hypothetical protein
MVNKSSAVIITKKKKKKKKNKKKREINGTIATISKEIIFHELYV